MSGLSKIYLANPYGFSKQQKQLLLPPIITKLESLGLEVWEPFQRNNQQDFSQPGWAYRIARADLDDVKKCDTYLDRTGFGTDFYANCLGK
jgi:nucleoside 2-deoxyribosyltransferase